MITVKNTNFYTELALKSFFKNTNVNDEDEFILIDNDGCNLNKFSIYNKIKIIKNTKPLSFAANVNQIIDIAKKVKKDLIFLTNDIIFTKDWVNPLLINDETVSIPSNNQIFQYSSECGNLKLKTTMRFEDFNENYKLLDRIVEDHKKKFKAGQKFKTLLMPFFCFKVPYKILCDVGHLDTSYGNGGGEDVDYRIRCTKKGYDVNFLLDSYLLHFNGRSTWGIETREQTEKRNKLYTQFFLKKWGTNMTQVFILRKDFNNILQEKKLENLFKRGQFNEIIKKLL